MRYHLLVQNIQNPNQCQLSTEVAFDFTMELQWSRISSEQVRYSSRILLAYKLKDTNCITNYQPKSSSCQQGSYFYLHDE